MKARYISSIAMLCILVILSACNTPTNLLKHGKYDKAVLKAISRIERGKGNSNDVIALEQAFNNLNNRDHSLMVNFIAQNQDSKWDEIYRLANKIKNRQSLVSNVANRSIPGMGRIPNLTLYNVDNILSQARQGAAEYCFQSALNNLEKGRQGMKLSARQAYDEFQNVYQYDENYKNAKQLQAEAFQLGVLNVGVGFHNGLKVPLPNGFEDRFLSKVANRLDEKWTVYRPYSKISNPDVYVELDIDNLSSSPESINNNRSEVTRSIQDGYVYQLDSKGNVLKDSLGNDLKSPKLINVYGVLLETNLNKQLIVQGTIRWYKGNDKNPYRTYPIEGNDSFSQCVRWFEGDPRAFSECPPSRPAFLPGFPSDLLMIANAIEDMRSGFARKVDDGVDLALR